MFLILLVDIMYWVVVVAGLALAWKGKEPRSRRVILGVVSLVVLVLGLPLSSMLWPPDWVSPVRAVRASANLTGYTLRYVQKPGSDFYMDTLEIEGVGGKTAVVHLNVDNGKCWFGRVEASENEVVFHCFPWGRMATVRVEWLTQNMEQCRTDRCDLSVAYFSQQQ